MHILKRFCIYVLIISSVLINLNYTIDRGVEINAQNSNGQGEITISNTNLMPLFDDGSYADKTKDRINLIFFMTQEIEEKEIFIETIKKDLGTNNSMFLNNFPNSEVKAPDIGMLEIGPFNENKDLFNFWLYDEVVGNDLSTNLGNDYSKKLDQVFDLQYSLPIYNLSGTFVNRSNALLPLMQLGDNNELASFNVGMINMYYVYSEDGFGSGTPEYLFGDSVLSHEMFHALFGLYDEYEEAGNSTASVGYPNCAPNLGTAQNWWSDYLNIVDPYFYTFRDQVALNYFVQNGNSYFIKDMDYIWSEIFDVNKPISQSTAYTIDEILSPELYKVDYVQGGCFSDTFSGQYRPSIESILNSSPYPIPNYIHRLQANKVLEIFSGTTDFNQKPLNQVVDLVAYNSGDYTFDPTQTSISYCDIIYYQEINGEDMYCQFETSKRFIPQQEMKIGVYKVINPTIGAQVDENLEKYTELPCLYSTNANVHYCQQILFDKVVNLSDNYIFKVEGAVVGEDYLFGYRDEGIFEINEFTIFGQPNTTNIGFKFYLEGALLNQNGGYEENMKTSISQFNSEINNDFVDIVNIEILNLEKEVIESIDAYLDSEGGIANIESLFDGIESRQIRENGSYYFNINHRNHIGIGTNLPIEIEFGGQNNIDFTDNLNVINNNQKQLPNGKYGLYMGDVDGNGILNAGDRNSILNLDSKVFVYSDGDINMDSIINSTDRNLVISSETIFETLN